ncbi:MAG: class I SAM-dependent methyltransferase [Bacillota bacterium]
MKGLGIDYDRLAAEYARHRRVHPRVLAGLLAEIDGSSRVLEVGCGTGNYIRAVRRATGCRARGVDPSPGMLELVLRHDARVGFSAGRAESLDFRDASFDMVFSVDVIHHVTDRLAYFAEAHRILCRGGKMCTVTDSEKIIRCRTPLSRYFPETVDVELRRYPRIPRLMRMMRDAGFAGVRTHRVHLCYDLEDLAPYRDRAFSSLHLIPDESFARGIRRMQRDLARGPVRCVSIYCMLWGVKP